MVSPVAQNEWDSKLHSFQGDDLRPTVDVCEGTGGEVPPLSSMQWLLFTLQVPIKLQRVSFFLWTPESTYAMVKIQIPGSNLNNPNSVVWFNI